MQTDRAGAREDYYSREDAGYFLGEGAAGFGLSGAVSREDFEGLAAGCTPAGEVQNAGSDDRKIGWDLTWSAPKSVSVLWSTADAGTREKIQAAHDHAVSRAIEFVEQHAAQTRRGSGQKNDADRYEKVGLVAAVYKHRTSREMDPQLHSHAIIFNVACRADGTVGAVVSHNFYEWKMAAGAAYRCELSQGLRSLGFEVERDAKSFRVAGVPEQLETEFSKRRQQIEKSLAEHGAKGARASEVAALDTRKAKTEVNRETLLQDWQSRAHERAPDWTPGQARETAIETREINSQQIAERQAEMTRERSTLSEAELYAAVATERQGGGNIRDIEEDAKALKADRETVTLEGHRQETRYTTTEMQKLEKDMVGNAEKMSKLKGHQVEPQKLDKALTERPTLTDEQKAAVRHIVEAGDVACIQGSAGSGKSLALGAASEAWEADGYRVRGAALSGKAAQELQKGSGIESTTLKRLEMDTRGYTGEDGKQHEATDKLSRRDILVIDEAGMSGSRQTAALIEDAQKAGAKVVLVGDTRQLQAIDAGAAFRSIQERVGAARIDTIQRQRSDLDRQAVKDLRDGHAERAIENLAERGRVHETDSGREAKQEAGQAVVEDIAAGKQSLALTSTRAEARDVNESARNAAAERGLLKGENFAVTTHAGEREFAAGDRVLFTRNNREIDVKNGDLCTVTKVERAGENAARMTVTLDRGGDREIDTSHYDHLDHGYCVTVHKAQGSTVDRAHVVASENGYSSKEWAYVAGSRAREETHIHADRTTIEELAPTWNKSRQKDVTLDYSPKQEREPAPKLEQKPKHEHEHGPAWERTR